MPRDAHGIGAILAGAVQHENGVRVLGHCAGDFDEMGVHGLGVGMTGMPSAAVVPRSGQTAPKM